jgi:hypothetical protein
LSYCHGHDRLAEALQPVRLCQDIHGVKRLDIAAFRDRYCHYASIPYVDRAAQMPDWYGDHKLMMFPALPFHRPFARLPVLPVMALMLRSMTGFARAAITPLLAMLVASAGAATAYAQNVPVVRDAEIEALVRDYARPIFKTAGLSKSGIDIILVNDPRFNASSPAAACSSTRVRCCRPGRRMRSSA